MKRILCLLWLMHLANSSVKNADLTSDTQWELLFHNKTGGPQELNHLQTAYGNILCRGCGNELASSDDLISNLTPHARYYFYDSLFEKEEVLVQVVTGELLIPYPVVTTSLSKCVGVGEWEEFDTWFPGYRWKPCVCPDCGEYIGWVFEAKNPSSVELHAFFAIILSSIVGESFADSLTVVPGGLSK